MNSPFTSLRERLIRSSEFLRFTIVAVVGLLIDLTAAYSTLVLLELPLVLAVGFGFACGACANYALHELWTFQTGARYLSPGRALKYFVPLAATLATRLMCVATLERLLTKEHDLTILILATGLSFGVNYLISKFIVFQPTRQNKETHKTDETP